MSGFTQNNSIKLWLTIFGIVTLTLFASANSTEIIRLTKHNVRTNITVSGLSAGAAFATAFSFIYSSIVVGAGGFSPYPYPIALAVLRNMSPFKASSYYKEIELLERNGLIDSTLNFKTNKFKSFVFRGRQDSSLKVFTTLTKEIWKHYGADVNLVSTINLEHCIPVADPTLASDPRMYRLRGLCNSKFNGVFEMFSYLFGQEMKVPKSTSVAYTGTLAKFDQTEYVPNGDVARAGLLDFGYVYTPAECGAETGQECSLHFAFPGCNTNTASNFYGSIPLLIEKAGYLQVADANNVIMIFPQVQFPTVCFDIFSYTSPGRNKYATKNGIQPRAVKNMYDRIVGQSDMKFTILM